MKYIKTYESRKSIVDSLIQSAKRGSSDKVKKLIKNGSNINVKDNEGRTPLMYATLNSFLMVAQILIKNGADSNLQDKDGRTALMMSGTERIKNLLLENGADVNITDNKGNNIIMDRLESRLITYDIEKLENHGLDLSTRNKEGKNLYDMIKELEEQINLWENPSELAISRRDDLYKLMEYIDKNHPEYKEEWEIKRAIDKYNL